jgi:hypothetical protein
VYVVLPAAAAGARPTYPLVDPLKRSVPLTSSLLPGVVTPIPTLPPNSANFTVPSALTSILGIPDTSLTEKITPVKSFVIENSCPALPSKLNVPFDVGYTLSAILNGPVLASAPLNTILGSAVLDPLFGVITMFLSVLAI